MRAKLVSLFILAIVGSIGVPPRAAASQSAPPKRLPATKASKSPVRKSKSALDSVALFPVVTDDSLLALTTVSTMRGVINHFRSATKGEFETTAEFLARQPATDSTKYAVRIGGDVACNPYFTYNADSAAVEFYLDARSVGRDYQTLSLRVACGGQKTGQYRASNAFGATTTVETFTDTSFEVRSLQKTEYRAYSKVRMSLSVEDAKTSKADLAVAVVFQPTRNSDSVVVQEDETYAGATIDSPISLTTKRVIVNALNVQLMLFNAKTGRIYARQQYPHR